MKFTGSFLVSISLIFVSAALFAQSGASNARSVAMGDAYTALATGVEAPSWNPANLGLKISGKKYRLNLVSVGVGLHNNSFTLQDYNRYNGEYLTQDDKNDILTSIPNEGLIMDVNSEVQAMGLSFGNIALTASGAGASDFSVSKDIADLVLNGNELDRIYDIGATFGEGWGVSSFGLSMGFPLSQFVSIGASAKYLRGFGYAKVREASTNFTTSVDGMHGSGRVVIDHALGGSGFGFDFGVAGKLSEKWTAGISLKNAYSNINWTKDTERFIYTLSVDSLSLENTDDATIDSVFKDADETIAIDPFSSRLPRVVRAGIARRAKRLTLALDYVQGLERGPGVSTTPMLALGTELRLLGFLPIRAGMSAGGASGFSTSAGFSLDFSLFSWDFAVASKGGSFSGRGIGVAFDWMFRL